MQRLQPDREPSVLGIAQPPFVALSTPSCPSVWTLDTEPFTTNVEKGEEERPKKAKQKSVVKKQVALKSIDAWPKNRPSGEFPLPLYRYRRFVRGDRS